MKPIRFACEETLYVSPQEIAERILNLDNWSDFRGFGVLPGIKVAKFELRTPQVVGSRFKVINTDGSTHIEEIVEWQPDRRLTLHMKEFSPPLSRLATEFEETWEFERKENATKVIRSFELHAKSALSWPLLWMISILLKKAIARHLRQLRDDPSS